VARAEASFAGLTAEEEAVQRGSLAFDEFREKAENLVSRLKALAELKRQLAFSAPAPT